MSRRSSRHATARSAALALCVLPPTIGAACHRVRATGYPNLSAFLVTSPPRVLGPADYRSMPWQNGGGRTTEIAVAPPGADLATFAWRVSVADVERDGPFSAFPGVDRTLVLLAGRGMRLSGPAGSTPLAAPMDVAKFAGEDELACALTDGPTRDFNLMVRRTAARATLDVVRETARQFAPAQALLCFAATGRVECTLDGQPPIVLSPEQTLLVEGGSAGYSVAVRALTAGGSALVCRIEAQS